MDDFVFVYAEDGKFIGIEFNRDGKECLISTNQESLPGVRLGRFVPSLDETLEYVTFEQMLKRGSDEKTQT